MRWIWSLLLIAACNGSSGDGTVGTAPGGGGSGGGGAGGGGSGGGGTSTIPLSEDHSAAVVYTADNNGNGTDELYVAAPSGRILNLSHPIGDMHHVLLLSVSPDESWVAFGVENGAESGLYVTSVGKTDPVRLSPAGDYVVEEIAWHPGSGVIAYRARIGGGPPKLFLVNRDGTGHADHTGPSGEVLTRIRWSDDGMWLAFHSDATVAGQNELYVMHADGTGRQQLSSTLADASRFRFVHFSWAPGVNCIAFRSDAEAVSVFELHVADLTTNPITVTHVSTEAGTTGNVFGDGWRWFADGSALLYGRDEASTGDRALYKVSKGGGDAHKVSGDPGGDVTTYGPAPVGAGFAFLVDGRQLFHGEAAGSVIEIAEALGAIKRLEWSGNGDRIAYLATDESPVPLIPVLEAFIVRTDGALAAERISDGGEHVVDIAWIEGGATLQDNHEDADDPCMGIAYEDRVAIYDDDPDAAGGDTAGSFRVPRPASWVKGKLAATAIVDVSLATSVFRSGVTFDQLHFLSVDPAIWVGLPLTLGANVDNIVPLLGSPISLDPTGVVNNCIFRVTNSQNNGSLIYGVDVLISIDLGAGTVRTVEVPDNPFGLVNFGEGILTVDLASVQFQSFETQFPGFYAGNALLGADGEVLWATQELGYETGSNTFTSKAVPRPAEGVVLSDVPLYDQPMSIDDLALNADAHRIASLEEGTRVSVEALVSTKSAVGPPLDTVKVVLADGRSGWIQPLELDTYVDLECLRPHGNVTVASTGFFDGEVLRDPNAVPIEQIPEDTPVIILEHVHSLANGLDFLRVELPDGRRGYVQTTDIETEFDVESMRRS